MKKTMLTGVLLTLATTILVGCSLSTKEQPTIKETTETSSTTKTVETPTEQLFTYKNTSYKFELTFPETWGKVTDQELPGDTIIISSEKSANRNFEIIMVGIDYKNTITNIEGTENFYLGENDSIAFYARVQSCLGGPACSEVEDAQIKNEVENLSKTFKNL